MKKETKKKVDFIFKVILVIIIILLLITNCTLIRKNKGHKDNNSPSGNIDIIEIKCDNNGCNPVSNRIKSLDFAQKNVSVKKGETIKLIVITNPSGLSTSKLTWKSSDTSIATVDKNGVVKGIKSGKVTITVTGPNSITTACTVNVIEDAVDAKKIQLTPDKKTISEGEKTQIKVVIEPENATNRDLVWSSSDTSIATVDANGVVKGIKAGTVTITAKTKDGKVVGTTTITVKELEIESLMFAQDSVTIKKDDTFKLLVSVIPCELSSTKLTWKSTDTNIVTVDENGNIKGINVGKAKVTVTSPNGKTAVCNVEVTMEDIMVKEIILTPDENVIGSGENTQVKVEIKPSNATNRDLVWSSSDPSIATVDANGVVRGIKSGTVTITAKTKDGKVVGTTTITIVNVDDEFEVYDDDHTPVTWNGASDLNIFSKSKYTKEGKIAPENTNIYQFVVRNSTVYNIKYNVDFIETNPYHINMKYKLKKNDTYIVDHFVNASELKITNALLNASANDTFYLEWKWVSSGNDNEIGTNPAARYGLKIEVKAESTNG